MNTITTAQLQAFEKAFESVLPMFDDKTIYAVKQAINAQRLKLAQPKKQQRTLL